MRDVSAQRKSSRLDPFIVLATIYMTITTCLHQVEPGLVRPWLGSFMSRQEFLDRAEPFRIRSGQVAHLKLLAFAP